MKKMMSVKETLKMHKEQHGDEEMPMKKTKRGSKQLAKAS